MLAIQSNILEVIHETYRLTSEVELPSLRSSGSSNINPQKRNFKPPMKGGISKKSFPTKRGGHSFVQGSTFRGRGRGRGLFSRGRGRGRGSNDHN
jgi:hypothetical protein